MEDGVGERAAEPFVKEQEEQGDLNCSAAISMRSATVRMGIRHRGNGMIVAA